MEKLLSSLSPTTTKLDNSAVGSDEFYSKAELKDRSHNYEIIKLGINLEKDD